MVRSLLSGALVRATKCKSGKIRDTRKPTCGGGTTRRLKYRARQARIRPQRTPEADRRRACRKGVKRICWRADPASTNDWKGSMDGYDCGERARSNQWARELAHTFGERASGAASTR